MSTHWALRLIHILYAAFTTIASWMWRRKRKPPKRLTAQRSKIPKHLCLNLVANDYMPVEETETAFLQCLQNVAAWCRALGIITLTVYDRHGVLCGSSENAYRRVFAANDTPEDSCESELEYPLTPPLSEASGSRPHSPESVMHPTKLNVITMTHLFRPRKRRNVAVRRQSKSKGLSPQSSNLVLHIVSRSSGKPAIVSASRLLLQGYVSGAPISNDTKPSKSRYRLTVSELDTVLEAGLPPPDFMIIHHIGGIGVPHPPMEFHGFPPWQITLTEFHRTLPDNSPESHPSLSELLGAPKLISETAFSHALDEYAGAEFRLGR